MGDAMSGAPEKQARTVEEMKATQILRAVSFQPKDEELSTFNGIFDKLPRLIKDSGRGVYRQLLSPGLMRPMTRFTAPYRVMGRNIVRWRKSRA